MEISEQYKNILITGCAGFIGSSLLEKTLLEGKNIIGIDNFDPYYDIKLKKQNIANSLQNPSFKFYQGDICDEKFLEKVFSENKIDVVVHLAGCAGVRNSLKYPEKYVKTNIGGTVNILEKMVKYNIKRMVFASSSSVYGNCTAEKFREDLPLNQPISPYAATKLSCEEFLYTYSKLYDIKTVCLRFFTVYGPKQRPDLAIRKFAESMLKDEPITVYGDGLSMRDYTYIDDIIDGVYSAIHYDKSPYEIINLGGNNPIMLNDLIHLLEKATGKKAIKEHLPMQTGDVIKTVSDITKAQNLLGYNPQTSFEQGISKFIDWLR